MDIQEIYRVAKVFRAALERISPELGIGFKSFPIGACGDTAILLGTHLFELGLGEFQYVTGEHGCREDDSWSSHAWLQRGLLIVDITADQFPEISESVIVCENSSWHGELQGEPMHVAHFQLYDEFNSNHLMGLYSRVLGQINNSPTK